MQTKKARAKPGTKGTGDYFRVIVRPKSQFKSFRVQDVGDPGGLERLAGHRSSGSWATHAWLISKDKAHLEGDKLVADDADAKKLLKSLGSEPIHTKGDIFTLAARHKSK